MPRFDQHGTRTQGGRSLLPWVLVLLLLAGHQLALAQGYTYTAGQNLGVFESRVLLAGESLYIPAGVTAYCDFMVTGPGVRIVNDGSWNPAQSALEYGAILINNGQIKALFLQVNNGLFINNGKAAYNELSTEAQGRINNVSSGVLTIARELVIKGILQNCGRINGPSYSLYPSGSIVPCGGPLPVTLVAFTARTAGPRVLLEWRVASELNASHYEVERSPDGQVFAEVGRVPARGLAAYSYPDQASAGAVFYRLRSVDTDGTATYSPVVVLAGPALVRRSYYNELGQALPGPGPGFYVELTEYENGAVERKKYVGL